MSTQMTGTRFTALMASLLALGMTLASQSASAQVVTVEYIHTDALGSPVAVTDQSGNVIQRTAYEPFGQAASGSALDSPGYAGHVLDAATGLNYMQQRYYDSAIGRFLSVDPVAANAGTGVNFARYTYAANNPYRYNDPDGRQYRTAFGSHLCDIGGCDSGSFIIGPPSVRSGDDAPATRLPYKPVDGKINKKNPKNGTADGGFDPTGGKKLRSGGARPHKGVDIDAAPGTPVVAAGPGTASVKKDPPGYGLYIAISHGDGLETRYAHLSSVSITNGELVNGGQVIGQTGTSGNLPPRADAHLHFEIRLDGVPQDPAQYFNYEYEE